MRGQRARGVHVYTNARARPTQRRAPYAGTHTRASTTTCRPTHHTYRVQGGSRRGTQRRTPTGHAEGTHTGDWGQHARPSEHAMGMHTRARAASTRTQSRQLDAASSPGAPPPPAPPPIRAVVAAATASAERQAQRRGCMGRVRKNSGARGGRGKGASAPGVAACPTCPSPPRQRDRRARQRHARGGEAGACRGGTRPASPHGHSVPVMRTSGPRSVPAGAAHAPAHAHAPTLRCRRKHAASTQRAHARAASARPASYSTPARSPPAPAPPHSLPSA